MISNEIMIMPKNHSFLKCQLHKMTKAGSAKTEKDQFYHAGI